MTFWMRLKERKLVQWALAYLASAWVLLQLTSVLGGMYDLPRSLVRAVPVLLAVGFLAALVLAWYHGEKGRQRVSGPELLMLGALLLIAGAAVAWVGGGAQQPAAAERLAAAEPPRATAVDARSLAVLPFADLSEAGDQKWFAEGLAEEILTSLSRLPELRVIGRNSSFLFTAGATDDRVIADTLGVAHLVKGSVRRVGDQVRVTAQLLRAADGAQLWSHTYDRNAADLLDVQRDVAEKVAAALDVLLDQERRERMFAAGTRNVEAFEAFLRGREILLAAHGSDPQATLTEANVWLGRAMELDPGFGRAALLHSDRWAHLVMDGPSGWVGRDIAPAAALDHLHADLARAARAAPDDFDRAIAEINRELFAPTWHRLPSLIETLRRHRASGVPRLDDPWGPLVLDLMGDLELAREMAERVVRSEPLEPMAWSGLVGAELSAGNLERARALLAEARRTAGDHHFLRSDEHTLLILAGEREALLARLERGPAFDAALAAAIRGDTAAALAAAARIEAASEWPRPNLLKLYHQLNDRERSRELVRRIDSLPAGPAILARELWFNARTLTFDLSDAPNFSARLAEAGVDPRSFRVMPRPGPAAFEEGR